MLSYEYKVIPAPKKASKIKGVRGTDQKFAASLAEIMNLYGRDGWEYQRTDTLPCEERQGFTGRTTTFQNMLIFRRKIEEPAEMSIRTPTVAPMAKAVGQAPAAARAEVPESVTAMSMPTFRSTVAAAAAPALAVASHGAPEGRAPRIGAAASEPAVRAPGIAAQ